MPFGKLIVIWYIFPRLGILYQEKSGNPDARRGEMENDGAGCSGSPCSKI
jgi:hypothetical protein